jgi:hypothetical protein
MESLRRRTKRIVELATRLYARITKPRSRGHPLRPSAVSSLRRRYPHDIANVCVLQLAGVQVSGNGELRLSKAKAARFLLLSLAPLVIAASLQLVNPSRNLLLLSYFWWLAYFFGLVGVSVAFSWAGCRMFYRSTESLSETLTVQGKIEYDRWADRYTAQGRQLPIMVIFAGLSVIALWLAARVPGIGQRLYTTPASYVAIAWAGLLVGNCGYWLAHGTELAYRLSRPGRMSLMWSAPGRSPGLERLARCYRYSFYMAAVGSAACVTPILYWAYRGAYCVTVDPSQNICAGIHIHNHGGHCRIAPTMVIWRGR